MCLCCLYYRELKLQPGGFGQPNGGPRTGTVGGGAPQPMVMQQQVVQQQVVVQQPAVVTATAVAPPVDDIKTKLEKLKKMFESGIIDEKDYETKKAQLLDAM